MHSLLQDKFGVFLGSLTASGLSVTWLETANQFVDFLAGLVAIVSGVCLAIYYWNKNKREKTEHS